MAKRNQPQHPLTLATLKDYEFLQDFSPPTGAFDPTGPWKHSYAIRFVGGGVRNGWGAMTLERRPAADGKGVTLAVEVSVLQSSFSTQQTKATVECASDALCTPRSWKLESVSLDTDGKPIELTRVEESGEVKDGGVEVRPAKEGMRPRTLKVPSPFTSNWSLFEAVQRLPGKETSPIQFALLEDLDLLKEGQRLTFRGETTLTLNGKTIPLQEYQQIGDGILPFHYNLDEQRRLIVALSGQRAYLWNPKAQEQLAEIQDRVLRKVQNEQKKNG